MVLILECILACAIYGFAVVTSALNHRDMWVMEYPTEIQDRYYRFNPELGPVGREEDVKRIKFIRLIGSILFVILVLFMVRITGVRRFSQGFSAGLIIWTVVVFFDMLVVDMGLFARWKRLRLPATEDMDEAYLGFQQKGVRGALIGLVIGVPVSALSGLTAVLFR